MLTRRSFALSAAASLVAAPAVAKMMPIVAAPQGYIPPSPHEQEEFKDYFNNAESDIGGCCGIGDGFKQGFTYSIWSWNRASGKGRYEDVVVLKSVVLRSNGYWVEVYDHNQDKYVWRPAPQNTWVKRPNPTGYYIVWTYYPEGACKVRCFAPLAQA